jgi:hypothetical protein
MVLNCFNLGSSKDMAPSHHAFFCTPTHISCVCSLACANTELQLDTVRVSLIKSLCRFAYYKVRPLQFAYVIIWTEFFSILWSPKSVAPAAVCNNNVMCGMQFVSTIVILERASLMTLPWLWRIVSGLSPPRPEFYVGPVCLGFMMDRVAVV